MERKVITMSKRIFELPRLAEYGRLAEIVNGEDPNPCNGNPQGTPWLNGDAKPLIPPFDCYGRLSGS